MSYDRSPKTKRQDLRNSGGRRRKREPNAYNSKIVKPPSEQRLRDQLRHAVTHRDDDALEVYDDKWGVE